MPCHATPHVRMPRPRLIPSSFFPPPGALGVAGLLQSRFGASSTLPYRARLRLLLLTGVQPVQCGPNHGIRPSKAERQAGVRFCTPIRQTMHALEIYRCEYDVRRRMVW